MYSFCAKFRQAHDICKRYSKNLRNSFGNISRVGIVSRFSDLKLITCNLMVVAIGINSKNSPFHRFAQCRDENPNYISQRRYNDRRKLMARLCKEINSDEDCKSTRFKCWTRDRGDINCASSYNYCASQRKFYYGEEFHSYNITSANVHDINYLNDIKLEYHDCGRSFPSGASSYGATLRMSTDFSRESSVKSAHLPSYKISTINILAKLNMRYFSFVND